MSLGNKMWASIQKLVIGITGIQITDLIYWLSLIPDFLLKAVVYIDSIFFSLQYLVKNLFMILTKYCKEKKIESM